MDNGRLSSSQLRCNFLMSIEQVEKERTCRTKDPPLTLPCSCALRNCVLSTLIQAPESKTTPIRTPVMRNTSNMAGGSESAVGCDTESSSSGLQLCVITFGTISQRSLFPIATRVVCPNNCAANRTVLRSGTIGPYGEPESWVPGFVWSFSLSSMMAVILDTGIVVVVPWAS